MRRFLIGIVIGACALVVLEVVAVRGLGALFSGPRTQQWLARLLLPAPHCPADGNSAGLGVADYGWSLRTLDGRPLSFAEFEGRTVFLNVWASWCGPCLMEMPSIDRLSQSMEGDNVAFVLLSTEEPEAVRFFAEQYPGPLPLYLADRVPGVFSSSTVPATFIIDPRGKIVVSHRGAARWDHDDCKALLGRLGRSIS